MTDKAIIYSVLRFIEILTYECAKRIKFDDGIKNEPIFLLWKYGFSIVLGSEDDPYSEIKIYTFKWLKDEQKITVENNYNFPKIILNGVKNYEIRSSQETVSTIFRIELNNGEIFWWSLHGFMYGCHNEERKIYEIFRVY